MLKRESELRVDKVPNMRGGKGTSEIVRFIEGPELHGKGKLFGKITLKPGVSIGLHTHVDDSETFYVLSGEGLYTENGSVMNIKTGDILYLNKGGNHSVENNGDAELQLMALILSV